MILAAIDIGSNAARLLINEVTGSESQKTVFTKLNLFRVPLRLGFDVFENKIISPAKITMMVETLKAYKSLINAYEVDETIACATSAMRDAENAGYVLDLVEKETGIKVQIISGDMEANLVYENHIAENMDKDHSYLYIDVGGGSTELSFFSNGKLAFKRSYDIGTIRLLKNQVKDKEWSVMKDELRSATKGHKEVVAIGSGGNINKIFSLSKKKEDKPLPIELLRDYYRELESFSVEDRIQRYNLKADRADVIVPALSVYINVMRWANASVIYVPKIGLADGLIRHLWDEINSLK